MDEAERAFLSGSVAKGLTGLKGHRSVGGRNKQVYHRLNAIANWGLGIRASNYNAIPEAGAERLVAYLKEFATA